MAELPKIDSDKSKFLVCNPILESHPSEDVDVNSEALAPVCPGDTLLESLALPTRMLTWLNTRGISTARELVSIDLRGLIKVRNLGWLTLRETRLELEKLFGCSWEKAGRLNRAEIASEDFVGNKFLQAVCWDQLRHALPGALRKVAIDDIALPARMCSYAEREGLMTLGDLAARSEAELKSAPNLGHYSLQQLVEAIRNHVVRIGTGRQLAQLGLLEGWNSLLQEQDAVRRRVLTLRAGLGGSAQTLQSIAEILGVSRERVRQIQNAGLEDLARNTGWLTETQTHIEASLKESSVALDTLAADPWWSGAVAVPEALDYFCEHLLGGKYRVVEVEERRFLARCSQEALDASWTKLMNAAARISLPAPLSAFQALVEPLTGALGQALATALFERLNGKLYVGENLEGRPNVVRFGNSRAEAILAILRTSPTPVRMEELQDRVGQGALPEEMLFFGSGLVGMEHHFPEFAMWKDCLVPAAIRVMEREAPEKQWLAHQLLDELREEWELPKWLTHWHLGSLLRRSGRVRYLGRLRVSLLASPEEEGRVTFCDELIRTLRENGKPMLREELVRELGKKTSVLELTLNMYLLQPQFLRCGNDRIGLRDRDLPGGRKALAEAVEHLWRVLDHRQHGLTAAHVGVEVRSLSKTHAKWPTEMCLSALRGDSRFRLAQSRAVGLSIWETVRVPTRLELIGQCIEEAGGRVTVEAVQRCLEAHYGESTNRAGVGRLANRLGAALRGEWIERALQG